MYAFTMLAALAAAAQQAPAPTPPPAGIAPHQQQVDTIVPSARPVTQAAPQPAAPSAPKPARHKGLHVSKAAVAGTSRAAGGAIAGPAGAAVAPVLVDRAGHKVKKLVHRHKHHSKPVPRA